MNYLEETPFLLCIRRSAPCNCSSHSRRGGIAFGQTARKRYPTLDPQAESTSYRGNHPPDSVTSWSAILGKDTLLVYGRIGSHAVNRLGSEALRYFMVRAKLIRSDSRRSHSTPRVTTPYSYVKVCPCQVRCETFTANKCTTVFSGEEPC
jgi:hypothetical protein